MRRFIWGSSELPGAERRAKKKKVWTFLPIERKQAEMGEPVRRKSLEVRVEWGSFAGHKSQEASVGTLICYR